MTRAPDVEALIAGVLAGDRALLAQAITRVESTRPEHREDARALLTALLPHAGRAQRVGISGVPGVGKSTFIEAFGLRRLDEGHRVAVLAVDPTSERTGGSILGDKTRMAQLAADRRAFIRPSPSSGALGGVGRRTREAIVVCEAAGFDLILVETVGVGQSETLVAQMVDVFLVLMLPGAGDELQGIKRGIMEVADLIAVNKADGDRQHAAALARRQIQSALHTLSPATPHWSPRALTCSAVEGSGLDDVWQAIIAHRDALEPRGERDARRRAQQLDWFEQLVDEALRTWARSQPAFATGYAAARDDVASGRTTPGLAVDTLLDRLLG
jgi:LAO/AO transport system kinase